MTSSHVSDGSLAGAEAAPPYGIYEKAIFWPDLADPLTNGPLIDRVTTPLINPVTGQPITVDIKGNPRVSGNSRDIGAVELPSVTPFSPVELKSIPAPLFSPLSYAILILLLGLFGAIRYKKQ